MKKISRLLSGLLAATLGLGNMVAWAEAKENFRRVFRVPANAPGAELLDKLDELPPSFAMSGTELVELGFDEKLVQYLLWNHGKVQNLEHPIWVNRHDETKQIDLSNFDDVAVTVRFEQLADVKPNEDQGWGQ